MITKRVETLLAKCLLPENAYCLKLLPRWFEKSKSYAETMMQKYGPNKVQTGIREYQVLFVMNHLCPNLHHFHPMPNAQNFRGDSDGYNRAYEEYMKENTQAELKLRSGVVQEGVHDTPAEFACIEEFVRKNCK